MGEIATIRNEKELQKWAEEREGKKQKFVCKYVVGTTLEGKTLCAYFQGLKECDKILESLGNVSLGFGGHPLFMHKKIYHIERCSHTKELFSRFNSSESGASTGIYICPFSADDIANWCYDAEKEFKEGKISKEEMIARTALPFEIKREKCPKKFITFTYNLIKDGKLNFYRQKYDSKSGKWQILPNKELTERLNSLISKYS